KLIAYQDLSDISFHNLDLNVSRDLRHGVQRIEEYPWLYLFHS
ncbi:MAG: hypothetical protein ACI8RA_001302, partial [Chlamydiales bacterium]